MRVLLSPTEEGMGRTHRKALVIVSATIAGLAMSFQPFAFAQVNSKENRLLAPTQVRPSSDQKTASTVSKKPHKLIRRPATTPTAAQQTLSTTAQTPPTNTTKIPATPTVPSQEGASAQNQSKDSFSNKAPVPTAFAAPLPSPLVGLTATGTGTPRAASSMAGSTVPSTRTAAAAPASSTPAPPSSMRRLFTEIPSTAQIMAYEDPSPIITTPTILRNPTAMSFSAIQNGTTPATQTLSISNGGTGTLAWTASSNSTWLTLNGTSSVAGSNLGSITVAVNPSGLAVGSRSGIITIVGPGSGNSPQTVTVTFDITAAPTPTIGLNATSLSFTTTQGGSNPAVQTISISNSGSGTLNWAATENTSWLSLSPASGTEAGTLSVSVATTGLTAGTYSAPVTITATGATNAPQIITISLTVTTPAAIGFSPTSMGFTATQGGANPASQALAITNTGGGALSWNLSDNATWLTVSPALGTGTGSATISVSTVGLAVGTYTGAITITATGASNTPRTVPVSLTVTAAPSPTIGLSPASLSFTAVQGAGNPAAKSVNITNGGAGTLTWSIADNAAWLTLSPASGTTTTETDPISVTVNTSGLTAGTYSAMITLTATGGATNTPQTVPVTLTVSAPATSSATLTWNANTDADLAGYKVYRATASGAYGAPLTSLPVGTLTYQATGLQSGTTYYFVVTAYDTAGNESTYSNEVLKLAN